MVADAAFTALIVGGGPAALEAALTLHDTAPGIRVGLLVPDTEYVYRPMSVVEPFARPGLRRYAYAQLADLGIDVHHDRLLRVESDDRSVRTARGVTLPYDALLLATGAQKRRAIPRVLTFGGPEEIERMHGLIQDVEGGYIRKLAFVAPPGAGWTLPLYELALLTAERAGDMWLKATEITVVSHEARPLEVLGEPASDLIESLLGELGIRFVSGTVIPGEASRIVALPVPAGHRIPGVPHDDAGFLPVDAHGRVRGTDAVWAAGDGTGFPIKQGGLATQQGAAAAMSIAAAAAGAAEPEPWEPVLRALLLVDQRTYFLRRRLDGRDPGQASTVPLWWPPTKIAGWRLAPFLDRLDRETGRPALERRMAEHSSASGRPGPAPSTPTPTAGPKENGP